MTLSIIIPAYNASSYIETCLISICNQNLAFSEYEILVVNDGSTDNTAEKVKQLGFTYPNIKLISQENKGNGAARNTGIEAALGNYIYFLDADDYIAQNTLPKLLKIALTNNLDIIGFASKNVIDSSYINSSSSFNENNTKIEILNGIDFIGIYNYKAEVWWYITKRDFLIASGFKFYNRKFVQDSYLTPTLFSKANRTTFINYDVHRYRKSNNSITRNTSVKHLEKHFNDLSYSVAKLYNLRNTLINQGVENKKCLNRLHLKQQRYVFIIIVRFIKSNFRLDYLSKMLSEFKSIEAYPLNKFPGQDYTSFSYRLATFIFNRKIFLFPIINSYRFFKKK